MKLTKSKLKQIIRENFQNENMGHSPAEEENNDLNLRWTRYLDNYKSDPRIRKATNSCLSSPSSNELSELLTDILESIQDESIRERFLVVVPQMVEDKLKEKI